MRIELIALKPRADTFYQPQYIFRSTLGCNVAGKAQNCQAESEEKIDRQLWKWSPEDVRRLQGRDTDLPDALDWRTASITRITCKT